MDARSNVVCDLVLSLDEEPPFEGSKRALLVVGGTIAAALVASLGFGVDLWSDLQFLFKFWFKAGTWKSGDLFELNLEAARQESAPIAG